MPKTELQMQSYDVMNRGKIIRVSGQKSTEANIPHLDPDRARFTRFAGEVPVRRSETGAAGSVEEGARDVAELEDSGRPSSFSAP